MSLSHLDDRVVTSAFILFGCFAVFSVVAKAGRETFPLELSTIISGYHELMGLERASTSVEQPVEIRTL